MKYDELEYIYIRKYIYVYECNVVVLFIEYMRKNLLLQWLRWCGGRAIFIYVNCMNMRYMCRQRKINLYIIIFNESMSN